MALICRMLTNNENSFISTYYGNIYDNYSIDYNPNLKNNSSLPAPPPPRPVRWDPWSNKYIKALTENVYIFLLITQNKGLNELVIQGWNSAYR